MSCCTVRSSLYSWLLGVNNGFGSFPNTVGCLDPRWVSYGWIKLRFQIHISLHCKINRSGEMRSHKQDVEKQQNYKFWRFSLSPSVLTRSIFLTLRIFFNLLCLPSAPLSNSPLTHPWVLSFFTFLFSVSPTQLAFIFPFSPPVSLARIPPDLFKTILVNLLSDSFVRAFSS